MTVAAATTGPGPKGSERRTKGFEVIRWVELHCVFTNGEWIGQPFRLLPWQKRLLVELFETQDDGLRRYRWAYISVPKKNGKTELAAALGLYLLIGDDEPAPLVVCAAASDDQADLVFNAAKTMCELSPTLRAVTEGGRFEREILVPSVPGAALKRVAAAAGTNDGQNIHAVICDELHEWVGTKGENVWNVLTNGTGVRRQPLVIQITTAGYDLETICGRQYEYANAVRRGEVDDRRSYSFVVEAPPEADHRDPEVWDAANPSFGVLVHKPFFEDQLAKKAESVFRRYFLNQWVASEEFFVPAERWDACYAPAIALRPDLPTYVGVDFAHFHDATAIVWAQRFEVNGKERIPLRAQFWQNPFPANDARHDRWVVPTAEVEEFLRSLYRQFPTPASRGEGNRMLAGPLFYCDPARFGQSMETLAGERLNIQSIAQSDQRMIPVAQALHELVMTGIVAHDGDPTLTGHIRNSSKAIRPHGGFRIAKPKSSTKRIDGAIAAGLAVLGTQHEPPKRARFYSF